MPSDHQNEKTHLFALPRELLVLIFKAQSSIIDAVHLAGTCHFLRNLYKSEHTIASTVLQREIPCYEEALRLAEAQVPNLQLRRSDALISKLYLNAKDAAWVCRLASCYFTSQGNPNPITTCRVHSWGDGSPSQRGILPHERARILHSWYFLKLHTGPLLHWGHERARIVHSWYLLNLHTGPLLHWAQQHHQSLTQELWAMSALQAYVLWAMASFLCELTDENAGEELGIEDQDPPDFLVGLGATPLPEWESTRLVTCEIAEAKKAVGPDGPFHLLTLHGPCDLCPLPGGAVCDPRELGKPLWEL